MIWTAQQGKQKLSSKQGPNDNFKLLSVKLSSFKEWSRGGSTQVEKHLRTKIYAQTIRM